MSEIILGLHTPSPSKKIQLQTRKGNDIDNLQVFGISVEDYENQFQKVKKQHPLIILRPKTISDVYNCHGMTFANKRTGIDENQALLQILKEDEYEEIKLHSDILAGDVVIYYSENGDFEHSGLIVEKPESNFLGTTTVLSKWGGGYEVIHKLYDCNYTKLNIKFYRCIN